MTVSQQDKIGQSTKGVTGVVSWFGIPTKNMQVSKKFYTDLFGWNIDQSEVSTGKAKEGLGSASEINMVSLRQNPPTSGTRMIGGLLQQKNINDGITLYFEVPSLETFVTKVKALGGKVIVERENVPMQGAYAYCKDVDGNPFGLWETNPNTK